MCRMPRKFVLASAITLAILAGVVLAVADSRTPVDYGKNCIIALVLGIIGIAVGGSLFLGLARLFKVTWYTRALGAVLSGGISLLGGFVASLWLTSRLHIETPTSHELIDMWAVLDAVILGMLSGIVGIVYGAGLGQPNDRQRD